MTRNKARNRMRHVLACVMVALLVAGLVSVLPEVSSAFAEEPETPIKLDDVILELDNVQSAQSEEGPVAGASEDEIELVGIDAPEQVDPGVEVQSEGMSVSNPRVIADKSLFAGQVATWDCVWFGYYPQTEVGPSDTTYARLQGANWDAKGDATVGGKRYHRLSKTDTTTHGIDWAEDGYESATYRYFLWEPIKWRVLEVSGNTALVVADAGLDCQRYNTNNSDVTWETSSVRSWLNGYAETSNQPRTDFTGNNFLLTAFSTPERAAIFQTNVHNANNTYYGTAGGNDTLDRVFLLSEAEVYNVSYGFANKHSVYDEARWCKPTDYAHAMGTYRSTGSESRYYGNCFWWLRSPGDRPNSAAYPRTDGWVQRDGDNVDYVSHAVRPALKLNLASSYVQAAGTVSSNGNVYEQAPTKGALSIAGAQVTGVKARTYTGKARTQAPMVRLGGCTLQKGIDYKLSYKSNVKAGTATMIITGIGNLTGSVSRTFKIVKAANPMRVKAVKRTAQATKVKKSAQVVAAPLKFTSKAKGKVTYVRVAKGSSKFLSVSKKTGKVTVKKGTKKGTYKVRIKVTAAGTSNYKKATKTLTCIVVVK